MSKDKTKFYLTTTIPYVNSDPHIGYALEVVQADVIARYRRLKGDEVFFNFGTDEHGQKIYAKAIEAKKDPKSYCDEYAAKFNNLKQTLNLSYDNFIRTTDPHHINAAQEFWRRCDKNGDIYKDKYQVKYCVGCELEKTETELKEGRCPIHPNLKIELIDEENYFFRFSKYKEPLLKLYEENPELVIPDWRLNEIRTFVGGGLKDFSISRIKEKMPWGIEVPGDNRHVMYVWFDALVNYISALGWPEDENGKFKNFWLNEKGEPNAIQMAGKDNLRQQSAMWQAMLMSAGLPNTKQIFIHGFITINGQKMSKSLGNVVNPVDLAKEFGTDAVRYYLLAELNPYEGGDYTREKFIHRYNGDLANGLGNLVARVGKLIEKAEVRLSSKGADLYPEVDRALAGYRFDEALRFIWEEKISACDRKLNEDKPWKLKGEIFEEVINEIVGDVRHIACNLQPFLPETAERILSRFLGRKSSGSILFPRI